MAKRDFLVCNKIVLLYLKRALKLERVGGRKETNESSSNQNKKKKSRRNGLKEENDNDTIIGTSISRDDLVLPRIVAWCSMVLDAHFNGVIILPKIDKITHIKIG